MRAIVVHEAGGPQVLRLEERPVPVPVPGQVLIRVRAFGLNRAEMFTRQGHSPDVVFPRILGIEAVGEVAACPGGAFAKGAVVATAMGGMGRDFDGSYAEYTCVPAGQVQRLETRLDWAVLGALPEMVQTAWGALNKALRIEAGETLLIRGGTSSVGLSAATLAKRAGLTVISTSRSAASEGLLRDSGADHVVVDDGAIAGAVRAICPGGVNKVLELVGTVSLLDSLQAAALHGIVAMAGIVGNRWSLPDFAPMTDIPTGVCLTSYSGGSDDFMATPLQEVVGAVEAGQLRFPLGPVFALDDIVRAHEVMEASGARGKMVVVT